MKKCIKRIVTFALAFAMLIGNGVIINAETIRNSESVSVSQTTSVKGKVPDDISTYVKENLEDLTGTLSDFDEEGMENINVNNLVLGKPFVITDIEEDSQNSVYYYPLIDKTNNKICCNIEAIKTTEGVTANISFLMVEKVKQNQLFNE